MMQKEYQRPQNLSCLLTNVGLLQWNGCNFFPTVPTSLLCKPHNSHCTKILTDSNACIFRSLEVSFLFRKLENDRVMTAAFLKSRNLFTGSFFWIRPVENMWGQEPGRQMCSLQTASLGHKLHKEEDWQLIGTNEARITISFKQIPFGPYFTV